MLFLCSVIVYASNTNQNLVSVGTLQVRNSAHIVQDFSRLKN